MQSLDRPAAARSVQYRREIDCKNLPGEVMRSQNLQSIGETRYMVSIDKKDGSPIKVSCMKCGHTAEILLPYDRRRDTDKLTCSKCLARGKDLRVEYLRDLKEMY